MVKQLKKSKLPLLMIFALAISGNLHYQSLASNGSTVFKDSVGQQVQDSARGTVNGGTVSGGELWVVPPPPELRVEGVLIAGWESRSSTRSVAIIYSNLTGQISPVGYFGYLYNSSMPYAFIMELTTEKYNNAWTTYMTYHVLPHDDPNNNPYYDTSPANRDYVMLDYLQNGINPAVKGEFAQVVSTRDGQFLQLYPMQVRNNGAMIGHSTVYSYTLAGDGHVLFPAGTGFLVLPK